MEWPPNLTIEQTAQYLNVSKRHVWEQIAEGRIPHFHIGRLTRVPRVQLDASLVNSHRHPLSIVPLSFEKKVASKKR